ncbi:MAG: hypothetical protein CL927_01625 [Deltaproteobacteria bacterium]|nr:hypothetical protein [Deltaproteobacteria bacterium]
MKSTHALLAFSLLAPVFAPSSASAQDDYDDLDAPSSQKKPKKQREMRRPEVREIVRGFYAKSNVGGSLYLLDFAGVVFPGTNVGLSLGQDIVDQERFSAAYEFGFNQGIHNGCSFEEQVEGCAGAAGPGPFIQGDLRTYTIQALLEGSFYPTRRIGLGFRAGGGVLFSPLLMDEAYYTQEVVTDTWGGVSGDYHSTPHPLVMGGPTIEYYTKLSHFSVGLDVDAFYAIGFDLGANVTGYLKYTF